MAGVDEVGRGALAGPVVAAAYLMSPATLMVDGVCDSKQLSANSRENLEKKLKKAGGEIGVGLAGAGDIDRNGIVAATLSAMRRAIEALPVIPELILIDGGFGEQYLGWFPAQTVWAHKADAHYYCVAAASIIAKVYRDRMMSRLANRYSVFEFERHKGYGTLAHRTILERRGLTAFHRRSFCTRYLAGK